MVAHPEYLVYAVMVLSLATMMFGIDVYSLHKRLEKLEKRR